MWEEFRNVYLLMTWVWLSWGDPVWLTGHLNPITTTTTHMFIIHHTPPPLPPPLPPPPTAPFVWSGWVSAFSHSSGWSFSIQSFLRMIIQHSVIPQDDHSAFSHSSGWSFSIQSFLRMIIQHSVIPQDDHSAFSHSSGWSFSIQSFLRMIIQHSVIPQDDHSAFSHSSPALYLWLKSNNKKLSEQQESAVCFWMVFLQSAYCWMFLAKF